MWNGKTAFFNLHFLKRTHVAYVSLSDQASVLYFVLPIVCLFIIAILAVTIYFKRKRENNLRGCTGKHARKYITDHALYIIMYRALARHKPVRLKCVCRSHCWRSTVCWLETSYTHKCTKSGNFYSLFGWVFSRSPIVYALFLKIQFTFFYFWFTRCMA